MIYRTVLGAIILLVLATGSSAQEVCTGNGNCMVGEYCMKAPGDCAGHGECTELPGPCFVPEPEDAVCGCDGNSYFSACLAGDNGVSVASPGFCDGDFCTTNSDCLAGEYCVKLDGNCDGEGQCFEMPGGPCPPSGPGSEVCGCDGNTYPDICSADQAGVSLNSVGVCPVQLPTVNGWAWLVLTAALSLTLVVVVGLRR